MDVEFNATHENSKMILQNVQFQVFNLKLTFKLDITGITTILTRVDNQFSIIDNQLSTIEH